MDHNGALAVEVARHSERIGDLEDDVKAVRKHIADLENVVERVDRKLDRLLTQKRIIIALVVLVGGGVVASINWTMRAQIRDLLLETHMVEMRRIP